MERFLVVNLVLILMMIGCSSESQQYSKQIIRKESFSVRQGKRLFTHYCSPCHGEKGDGFGIYLSYELEPQPPDFTTPEFFQKRNDEMLIMSIKNGSIAIGKSNLCPPWGNTLNNVEIEYLVKFIKKINEEANADSKVDKESGQEDERKP